MGDRALSLRFWRAAIAGALWFLVVPGAPVGISRLCDASDALLENGFTASGEILVVDMPRRGTPGRHRVLPRGGRVRRAEDQPRLRRRVGGW
ncbi:MULTISPECIES: hypothetical protein [unclassified Amycolatopsis]|uniref:hypothetical protein n=1 Tax=unclassified Amycolatopsis TaxID=2618356 RepID=UPI001C696FDE|nr:hypothetical protein [Amycolatopsis sp. DSM 110486]QYN19272.1 hypothetical protein K1T34_42680 [Amycolatopsis sp. DSM 110486]